jgi:hypothetical protein
MAVVEYADDGFTIVTKAKYVDSAGLGLDAVVQEVG